MKKGLQQDISTLVKEFTEIKKAKEKKRRMSQGNKEKMIVATTPYMLLYIIAWYMSLSYTYAIHIIIYL